MPITSLTDNTKVKNYAGISGSADDTLLTTLCGYVTAFIENYCNRKWLTATITDELHSSKYIGHTLLANYAPFKTLTNVSKRQSGTDTWDTLTKYTDFDVEMENGEIHLNTADSDLDDIKLTYTTETTVPLDVEFLATKLVAKIYNKRKSEGVSQEQLAEANITWSEFLNEADQKLLARFKRILAV